MNERVHADAPARCLPWFWRSPGRGEHFRRCSYCGSINPDDLSAEKWWTPNWADMKYGWPHKFYVDICNRVPDRLYCTGGAYNRSHAPGVGWVAGSELTEEQCRIIERDGVSYGANWYLFGTRENHHAKFYTVHLADPKLDPEVKTDIEHRSGIRFEFDGNTVTFRAAA